MAIKLNTASGGSVSIEPTNTASNYTLTVPAQTGTVVASDSSGNVGIGTTSPVANRKLTIGNTGAASTMRINSPTGYDAFIEFTENNSTSANTYWQIDKTPSTHAMQFWNGSERMRINANGDLLFNSGYGSAAVAYGCRAWVNFNGEGTPSIRNSGNVSSITDNGTGDYTINFATALPDANFSVVTGDNNYGIGWDFSYATTSFRTRRGNSSFALQDTGFISAAVFR